MVSTRQFHTHETVCTTNLGHFKFTFLAMMMLRTLFNNPEEM